jgi:hypothetical protein
MRYSAREGRRFAHCQVSYAVQILIRPQTHTLFHGQESHPHDIKTANIGGSSTDGVHRLGSQDTPHPDGDRTGPQLAAYPVYVSIGEGLDLGVGGKAKRRLNFKSFRIEVSKVEEKSLSHKFS